MSAGKSRTRRIGPGPTAVGVEHGDVGERAGPEHAAVGEPEEIGGLLRQLVDRTFEREHLALAYPVAEEVGGQRGVAQLTDVRPGIGEAERAAGLVEEHRDAVGVVVGEDRLHAERLDVTLLRAEVEQRVERRRSRARSATAASFFPTSSGCAVDSMIS